VKLLYYNATIIYFIGSKVIYNEKTFKSKSDNNLNHTPVGDITDKWWEEI
jgi:hypothetical protein